MTAVCGGGTSARKTDSPAQVFATSMAAQAAIEALFGVESNFAALMVFVASQLLDLTAFCAVDPPAVPPFTAADITGILTGSSLAGSPGYAKLAQLAQVGLWYVYCHCTSTTATTPTAPVYPTAPVVSNPGDGPVPLPTAGSPCDFGTYSEGFGYDGSGNFTSAGFNRTGIISGVSTIAVQYSSVATAGSPYPITEFMDLYKADGTTLLATLTMPAPAASSSIHDQVFQFDVPAGVDRFKMRSHSDTPTGAHVVVDLAYQCYCGSGSAPNAFACCPPDPQLQALLQQIMNAQSAMYAAVNLIQRQVAPFAYVTGASHTGLTGAGQIAVADLLGMKLLPTTIPGHYGSEFGDPDTLWLDSWIRWGNADGWGQREFLTASPFVSLPALAGQYTKIGYSLAPGIVVDAMELVREP